MATANAPGAKNRPQKDRASVALAIKPGMPIISNADLDNPQFFDTDAENIPLAHNRYVLVATDRVKRLDGSEVYINIGARLTENLRAAFPPVFASDRGPLPLVDHTTIITSCVNGVMMEKPNASRPAADSRRIGQADHTSPAQSISIVDYIASDQPKAAPSTRASNGDSTPCLLLGLCPELRVTIWEYVYTADIDKDGTVDLLTARHPTTSLLLVCRSIQAEAKKLHSNFTASYWRNTEFAVNALDFNRPERELIQRLKPISDSILRHISHLTFRFVAIRKLYEPSMLPRPTGTATFMPGGGWPTSYLKGDFMILVGMGVVLPWNDEVTGDLRVLGGTNSAHSTLSAMRRGEICGIFGPATLREQLEWLWQNL
ncbi:hypothetical protein TI39_contig337g00005 [Zymoseptoria brevis]|uniref:Uncharacterized protein n=1 Tax=Zymoseptoria brevis TaxID=1047168 RepID=A0A0F4GVL0_9PEZI|nr:hypothetical protein TI39_contig337g00005 [Zymoseptoria brevis]